MCNTILWNEVIALPSLWVKKLNPNDLGLREVWRRGISDWAEILVLFCLYFVIIVSIKSFFCRITVLELWACPDIGYSPPYFTRTRQRFFRIQLFYIIFDAILFHLFCLNCVKKNILNFLKPRPTAAVQSFPIYATEPLIQL